MQGLMQDDPINLVSILAHAGRWHGEQEIVTNSVEGGIRRQSYAETLARTTRLASSLRQLGIEPGDRVATMAWNTSRHLETWYAVSGQGAICHTVNPRLFADQIRYIVGHAEDRLLFVDLTFIDAVEDLLRTPTSLEAIVIMTDRQHMPKRIPWSCKTYCYEDLLSTGSDSFAWPVLDDNTASSLCYTSGTTGNPKGVLYSHRGNLLHAYASCMPDVFDLSATDTILMIVPMFHANSWGLAYAGPMTGARLVMPGPHLDGRSIQQLITEEAVTRAAAVPTVWATLLSYLIESGKGIEPLTEIVVGGAAVPRSMIEDYRDRFGVSVTHAWGMTEMTPVGTVNHPTGRSAALDGEAALSLKCKQGRVPYGVDMKIVDDNDHELPRDGETAGRLLVKGPWIIDRYYRVGDSELNDSWFDTGDIATIDPDGFMQITDRAKDVIKSGGEWISSVDIENAAMGMRGVTTAACIGARHPKWGERPVLLVVTDDREPVTEADVIEHLSGTFAKWQLPDAVAFVDQIPLTATGKIDKKPLRRQYADCLLK